jgi:hypothetical protein
MKRRRKPIWTVLALAADAALAGASTREARTGEPIRFNRDIRPILSDRCYICHGPDQESRQADLRLDVRESALRNAVVPGRSAESELIQRVASGDPDERMPPPNSNRKPLSAEEIERLRRWIDEGAEYEPHWSLTPPRWTAPPEVSSDWPRGPIDAFLLAPMQLARLAPSPEADARTLRRRLSYDLLGLPPSPDEADLFAADARPDRHERTVDRLLASVHYGERMAVYWLDLVRYADTVGYHGDQEHHISPYRDYVIDAWNANTPFDVFTRDQLAGDLVADPTVEQRIATGYNRVLQTSHEGGVQAKEYLAKYAADRVRNVSEVWLGATMGCAECHDHKFDPLTQRDFYRLAAFFADIEEKGDFKGALDVSPTSRPPEIDVLARPDREEIEEARREIARLEGEGAGSSHGDERAERLARLRARVAELESRKRRTMIVHSVPPREVRVLARGDWMDESGERVEPDAPEAFGRLDRSDRRPTRLDLAEWMMQPEHPRTSRVLVNRLWYLFFGEGLARTLDDLGSQGEWPTHPELLDWAAVELADRGWDVKAAVRAIVESSAYRQSSLETPEHRRVDPQNRLFARQNRFRLPAEAIRDGALETSGLLVLQVGGPSVKPYQPAGYYRHLNFPKREYQQDHGASLYRRSLYTHWQRQYLHPAMKAFDAPSREECTARRAASNTPSASLVLLNDVQFVECARAFAERILREGGATDEARIDWAWREALGRPASPSERAVVMRLLESHRRQFQEDVASAKRLLAVGELPPPADLEPGEAAAWTSAARTILNLDERIVRD